MNQKDLTETFMMISNWNKPFGLHDFTQIISALQGLIMSECDASNDTCNTWHKMSWDIPEIMVSSDESIFFNDGNFSLFRCNTSDVKSSFSYKVPGKSIHVLWHLGL